MTRDNILSLSGDELDAMVAEHVMGVDPRYCTTFNDPIYGDHYKGRRYSTDPSLLITILDRMIALGWLPTLDYDDFREKWEVAFTKIGYEQYTSTDLNEAVCKCALIAVLGV